jgi:D-alanyl-D-alanine carboxypeptidase
MRSLIEQYIVAASSVKTGSVVADAGGEAPAARPASPRAAEGRSAEGHAKANRVAASSPAAAPPSPSRMLASTPAPAAETPADAAAASPITALLADPAVLATEPIRPIAVKTVNVRLTRTAGTAAPGMSADQEQYGGAPARSGWVIQIGAFEREREARQKLSAARAKAAQFLGHASPFTETVVKGEKTLYRARFAGLQKDEAEEVCRQLKRNDFECMTVRN